MEDEAQEVQALPKVQRINQEFDGERIAVKCLGIMVAKYENLPRELWDLCRTYGLIDMKEKRTLSLQASTTDEVLESLLTTQRFHISGITTNGAFNKPLTPLPASLKRLRTGPRFNQPIRLSSGIEVVHLGRRFNNPIEVPPSVRQFTKVGAYTHPLHLPEGVIEATFLFRVGETSPPPQARPPLHLPNTLRRLRVDHPMPLPPYLTALTWDGSAAIGMLPETLEELEVCDERFNHALGRLPESLRILDLNYSSFDHPLQELPAGLKELLLPEEFSHPLVMPAGLEVVDLYLREAYAHPINLPSGLRELYLVENHPVQLPAGVVLAHFGVGFDQPVVFPPSVEEVLIRNPLYTHDIEVPKGCRVRYN